MNKKECVCYDRNKPIDPKMFYLIEGVYTCKVCSGVLGPFEAGVLELERRVAKDPPQQVDFLEDEG